MAVYAEEEFVVRRIKRALAFGVTTPDLDTDDIDDLVTIAERNGTWSTSDLNAVIAQGWTNKAGLVAGQYDIGGGNGKYLKRSNWWDHCMQMANSYATGAASFDPDGLVTATDGIGEIVTVQSHHLFGTYTGEWS